MTITGQQLRKAREAKGLSRNELARSIGLHYMAVVHVENNKTTGENREKIAKALGLTDGTDINEQISSKGDVKFVWPESNGDVNTMVNSPSLDAGEHQEIESPIITADEIVGNSSDSGIPIVNADVTFPGALVKVAREQHLTVNQMIAMIKIEAICAETGNYEAGGVSERGWLDLLSRLKGAWL